MYSEPPGSYEICDVCFWEDDAVQLRWPDWAGGANRPSLIDAQTYYQRHQVSEGRLAAYVRPAKEDESLDEGWRPIDPALDAFEPRGQKEAPWPHDLTTLYYWRPSFWRREQ